MKKTIIYSILVAIMSLNLQAQTTLSDKNYIHTIIPQEPITISDIEAVNCSNLGHSSNTIENVSYFDGLGRPMQQRGINASPDQKDIVVHMQYDDYGRQDKEYLPFASPENGSFQAVSITSDINSYYLNRYPDDFPGITDPTQVNAYSENVFEKSPLNTVLEQGAPGAAWKASHDSNNDHTIKFDWDTNTINEVVQFEVVFANPSNTEVPTLQKNGFYPPNQLQVNITKDENWTEADGNNHTTREYKDKLGRVILKRSYASTSVAVAEAHDTYYVYDSFGNLSYVIPPKVTVSDSVSANELSELCYQYRYDKRNRLIEKKIPGKGWEYIIYDVLDRPTMTQDANMRKINSGEQWDTWLFTKYDALGRIAYTGYNINGSTRKVSQGRYDSQTIHDEKRVDTPFDNSSTKVYYTKNARPTRGFGIYTINYYDDYQFLDSEDAIFANPGTSLGESISNATKSLPTGTKVRVLGTNDWITTVTYYDKKSRPIYVVSKNKYLNTIDIVETKLDFTGRVLQTKTTHTKDSNAPIVTLDTFTYDHMGRLLTQTQKINNQAEEVIVSNTYDELGQLQSKTVGGGLQDVDYDYNIRGWLKAINEGTTTGGKLFGFAIDYNTGINPLYNGNISATSWQTANDNVTRSYAYTYDALNRITSGVSNDGRYDLSNVSYDKMGNILSLNRKGHTNAGATTFGDMDILSYMYDTGNKLLKVTDTGSKDHGFKDGTNTNDDFEYDANGNMIIDRNKGITGITYNHLNLPETVAISNSANAGSIGYTYDASGGKLKKIVTNGSDITNMEYVSGYVYENGSIKQISHPEGYLEPKTSGGYQYVYRYKDIWRNTRITYADDNNDGSIASSEIRREQNYYPFGLEHKGYNTLLIGAKNNFKTYQDQEFTEDLGLNTHEWRFRVSDPAIGRFWQIDPLAEDYTYNATYAFQENKMGMGVELEGLELAGWGLAMYVTDIVVSLKNNTAVARNQVLKGTGKIIETELTNQETNQQSSGISGMSVSKVQDISEIGSGLKTINKEVAKTAIKVGRDSAKTLENTGDTMVVVAPLAGPFAPEIAGIGGTISGIGAGLNITLDFIEGDYNSAATGAVVEISSFGVGKVIENIPGFDEGVKTILGENTGLHLGTIIPILVDDE